jgi:ADP-L-glycero-D-manno-heptose 6-epimerase
VKVVVTGAAGFIGSNLVHGLNRLGIDDVIAVDSLEDGSKFHNLQGTTLSDYFDREEFYDRYEQGDLGRVDAIFHEGACSDTMLHDGRLMLDLNYRCSKRLLDACLSQGTRLLYASSAAVYGAGRGFREVPEFEQPLNVYGYSKLLFDQVVRRHLPVAPQQVVGFRYFNVYGPREQHKARMASVAFHQFHQMRAHGQVSLFGAYGGYGAGEHRRDFIHVDDVVAVNLWFLEHPALSGIFNLGTGRSQPFNDIASAVVNTLRGTNQPLEALVEPGPVRYLPFPDALIGKYQCFTEADLSQLRRVGCEHEFADVETGVARYVAWLAAQN